MKVKVLLFGVLAEKAGTSNLELEDIEDLDALKEHVMNKFPDFRHLSFQASLNRNLAKGNEKLSDGDEVALLPPFAGG